MKKLFCSLLVLTSLLACLTVSAAADELTQLAAPTNLEWGKDYWYWDREDDATFVEQPGMMSWSVNTPCQNKFAIYIYNAAGEVVAASPNHSFGSRRLYRIDTYLFGESILNCEWNESYATDADPNLPSGTYYFTVQALGDKTEYSDSEIATSSAWTYTAPEAMLPVPTNLRWDGSAMLFDEVPDTTYRYGYEVAYYYENPETNELMQIGWMSSSGDGSGYSLDSWDFQNFGEGKYYFQVRAASKDMTQVRGSYWSPLSPAFTLSDMSEIVDSGLSNISGNYEASLDESGELDEEMAGYMKDELWYNSGSDVDMMADAMAGDTDGTGTMKYIEALEAMVGGAASVNVAADAPEGLSAENVSIVGANLNTYGKESATLNVGKADEGVVIPEMYHNAVQFSMSLEGTAEGEDQLKVPVQITMPVPAGVNPSYLAIIHFRADGTYEEVPFPHIYTDGGVQYVSFIVTSFSTFAFAEREDGLGIYLEYFDTSIHADASVRDGETIFIAIYDWDYRLLGVSEIEVEAGAGDYGVFFENVGEATYAKAFMVDCNGKPVCESAEIQLWI